jgi:hypothetical protein
VLFTVSPPLTSWVAGGPDAPTGVLPPLPPVPPLLELLLVPVPLDELAVNPPPPEPPAPLPLLDEPDPVAVVDPVAPPLPPEVDCEVVWPPPPQAEAMAPSRTTAPNQFVEVFKAFKDASSVRPASSCE